MKTKRMISLGLVLVLPLAAAVRESADYGIAAESTAGGGGRSISAAYTNDAGIGGIVGLSTLTAPAGVVRHGYVGQLYDVVLMNAHATPTSVDENAHTQLGARLVLDDEGWIELNPATVNWSVASGPLTGITAAGLATAGSVWQDTMATVTGHHSGHEAMLGILVRDVDPDNLGLYAGDGLPDQWQVAHFGLNNPLAAPDADPDGDGQDNAFEELVGGDPTDPRDRFALEITRLGGGTADFRITRAIPGRTYELLAYQNPFDPAAFDLIQSLAVDEPSPGPVTLHDPAATQASRFYTLRITKPPAD